MERDAEDLESLDSLQARPMKIIGTTVATDEIELMDVSSALSSEALTEKANLHGQARKHCYLVHFAKLQQVDGSVQTEIIGSTEILSLLDLL